MTIADATSSTVRLLNTGPIPGWAGLLLFVTAGALVLWQLRRDFAAVKANRLTRQVLPALRLAIVALIVWLLCQPVLLIVRRWTPPAEVMLVVDSGNSMRVNEGGGNDLSRQLDALEAVGRQPIARRNSAASRAARACAAIGRATSSVLESLQGDLDSASTGLPLGPSVGRKLDGLAADLRGHADALIAARAQLPAEAGNTDIKQSVAQLASAAQLITAAVEAVIADGAVVGREASKSPTLLDAYLVRLKKLSTDAESARKGAADVQEKLDKALLTPKELEDARAKPITRQALADMAADRLATPSAGSPSWDRQRSAAVAGGWTMRSASPSRRRSPASCC